MTWLTKKPESALTTQGMELTPLVSARKPIENHSLSRSEDTSHHVTRKLGFFSSDIPISTTSVSLRALLRRSHMLRSFRPSVFIPNREEMFMRTTLAMAARLPSAASILIAIFYSIKAKGATALRFYDIASEKSRHSCDIYEAAALLGAGQLRMLEHCNLERAEDELRRAVSISKSLSRSLPADCILLMSLVNFGKVLSRARKHKEAFETSKCLEEFLEDHCSRWERIARLFPSRHYMSEEVAQVVAAGLLTCGNIYAAAGDRSSADRVYGRALVLLPAPRLPNCNHEIDKPLENGTTSTDDPRNNRKLQENFLAPETLSRISKADAGLVRRYLGSTQLRSQLLSKMNRHAEAERYFRQHRDVYRTVRNMVWRNDVAATMQLIYCLLDQCKIEEARKEISSLDITKLVAVFDNSTSCDTNLHILNIYRFCRSSSSLMLFEQTITIGSRMWAYISSTPKIALRPSHRLAILLFLAEAHLRVGQPQAAVDLIRPFFREMDACEQYSHTKKLVLRKSLSIALFEAGDVNGAVEECLKWAKIAESEFGLLDDNTLYMAESLTYLCTWEHDAADCPWTLAGRLCRQRHRDYKDKYRYLYYLGRGLFCHRDFNEAALLLRQAYEEIADRHTIPTSLGSSVMANHHYLALALLESELDDEEEVKNHLLKGLGIVHSMQADLHRFEPHRKIYTDLNKWRPKLETKANELGLKHTGVDVSAGFQAMRFEIVAPQVAKANG